MNVDLWLMRVVACVGACLQQDVQARNGSEFFQRRCLGIDFLSRRPRTRLQGCHPGNSFTYLVSRKLLHISRMMGRSWSG